MVSVLFHVETGSCANIDKPFYRATAAVLLRKVAVAVKGLAEVINKFYLIATVSCVVVTFITRDPPIAGQHARRGNRYQNVSTCCGVVGSTLAFVSIGHGFESEHHLFSHHSASAFSKLKSLAKCLLDYSVRRLM